VTALDPRTGEWFVLPPGPVRDRQAAVWMDDELVITGSYPTASPWALRIRG
jgi:hypothetical protein